jgi:hypothetical protein
MNDKYLQIPRIGSIWKNRKTKNNYKVLLLSYNSENPTEVLVSYAQPLANDFKNWTRPLALFLEKFDEV